MSDIKPIMCEFCGLQMLKCKCRMMSDEEYEKNGRKAYYGDYGVE